MSASSTGPLDVTLRTMQPADIAEGLRLCRSAGWNQLARDWELFLTMAPDGACVAETGGRVIGTAATMPYGALFGWIAMVLVDEAFRGRGIGTQLLDEALVRLAHIPLARLDATPAGYPIYLKRGFVEEYRLQRMQATAPAEFVPPPGSIRPMTSADLPEVTALDEAAFGANRAAVLSWMLEGAPEYAWVARSGGRAVGFVMGRHGYTFDHLGAIVAADAAVARQLAEACLRPDAGRPFVLDATPHSPAWLQALESLGFKALRPLIRMTRGSSPIPGDRSTLFAVLGPDLG
jgi:ribosomal protein S18 acetylase RimI-like enzyme